MKKPKVWDIAVLTGVVLLIVMFVLFVSASNISLMSLIDTDPETYGMLSILYNLLGTARMFIFVTFPFILIFSAALCVSNISLIRHEGKRLVNFLGIILSILMIGGAVIIYFSGRYISGSASHVLKLELASQLFSTILPLL